MLNRPALGTAAQLSAGYLNQKVREIQMWIMCHAPLDSNYAQFLSKVNQKVCVEDSLGSPGAVDIGGNELVLSLESLRAHGGDNALYFRLVRQRTIFLNQID